MALPKARLKEILSEAGCDAEHIGDAVDKILAGHVATVDALKEQIWRRIARMVETSLHYRRNMMISKSK